MRHLDRKHGSFFISRLILVTGINVRTFDASSYDDPIVVGKIVKALQKMLPEPELEVVLSMISPQR